MFVRRLLPRGLQRALSSRERRARGPRALTDDVKQILCDLLARAAEWQV